MSAHEPASHRATYHGIVRIDVGPLECSEGACWRDVRLVGADGDEIVFPVFTPRGLPELPVKVHATAALHRFVRAGAIITEAASAPTIDGPWTGIP